MTVRVAFSTTGGYPLSKVSTMSRNDFFGYAVVSEAGTSFAPASLLQQQQPARPVA